MASSKVSTEKTLETEDVKVEDLVFKTDDVEDIVEPVSKFWSYVDEVMEDWKEPEPYAFDAIEPPLLISAPTGVGRALALAELLDNGRDLEISEIKPLLQALCGSQFKYVWNVIKDLPIDMTLWLINDMNDHFYPKNRAGRKAEKLPGGESA